jgi:hypothetical protein
MRKQLLRFGVLLAMTFILGVSVYQRTTKATLIIDQQCSRECKDRYIYCNANPDGYWRGLWVGGECALSQETVTFCETWECPNNTKLYNHCLSNPTLSDCTQETDPVQEFCNAGFRDSCHVECTNLATLIGGGAKCTKVDIKTPVGSQCSCTYVVGPF